MQLEINSWIDCYHKTQVVFAKGEDLSSLDASAQTLGNLLSEQGIEVSKKSSLLNAVFYLLWFWVAFKLELPRFDEEAKIWFLSLGP